MMCMYFRVTNMLHMFSPIAHIHMYFSTKMDTALPLLDFALMRTLVTSWMYLDVS